MASVHWSSQFSMQNSGGLKWPLNKLSPLCCPDHRCILSARTWKQGAVSACYFPVRTWLLARLGPQTSSWWPVPLLGSLKTAPKGLTPGFRAAHVWPGDRGPGVQPLWQMAGTAIQWSGWCYFRSGLNISVIWSKLWGSLECPPTYLLSTVYSCTLPLV